jgi:hypothetical protein
MTAYLTPICPYPPPIGPDVARTIARYERDSQALKNCIRDVGQDALIELKALMWVGRGDYGAFETALADARNLGEGDIEYMAEKPELPAYLRAGLSSLGLKDLRQP